MSYLDWHVGMKVVCVDADMIGGSHLRVGLVYTVRAILGRSTANIGAYTGSRVAIRLVEVSNQHHMDGVFAAARFRPLQTRKTDITQFQAMLHDQRQKVPA